MPDGDSPDKQEEPLDIQDINTPSFLRKDVIGFRKTLGTGLRNRDKEGGSARSDNLKSSTRKIRPNQITSLDSLGYSELDSYQDNASLKDLKTVVKKDK